MVELLHPRILAVAVAASAALLVASMMRRRGGGVRVPPAEDPHVRAPRWARVISGSAPVLRGGATAALALFVAGPVHMVQLPGDPTLGVGMMIALDVSESMGEVGPDGTTRLADAVNGIRHFVGARAGDRVGLVTFGGEALVRVPPSNDRRALEVALSSVRPGEDGDGTAIGTALGLAAVRLRALEARSRVIVLVTDGRSNAGVLDPLTAARAAAALGQRIYVVDVAGGDGDGALLAEVARAGAGRRWVVSDRDGEEGALRELGALEPSSFPGPTRAALIPRAAWLLWLALVLLVGERTLLASRLGRLG